MYDIDNVVYVGICVVGCVVVGDTYVYYVVFVVACLLGCSFAVACAVRIGCVDWLCDVVIRRFVVGGIGVVGYIVLYIVDYVDIVCDVCVIAGTLVGYDVCFVVFSCYIVAAVGAVVDVGYTTYGVCVVAGMFGIVGCVGVVVVYAG